jgi:hypothetical protein
MTPLNLLKYSSIVAGDAFVALVLWFAFLTLMQTWLRQVVRAFFEELALFVSTLNKRTYDRNYEKETDVRYH